MGTMLICFDGSETAQKAITSAASLLSERSALVLNIWQPVEGWSPLGVPGFAPVMMPTEDLDDDIAHASTAIAEAGAAAAAELGLQATARSIRTTGPVWRVICDLANEIDASVVVIGAEGHSALGSIMLGSVSHAVTAHCQCPVLVVHA